MCVCSGKGVLWLWCVRMLYWQQALWASGCMPVGQGMLRCAVSSDTLSCTVVVYACRLPRSQRTRSGGMCLPACASITRCVCVCEIWVWSGQGAEVHDRSCIVIPSSLLSCSGGSRCSASHCSVHMHTHQFTELVALNANTQLQLLLGSRVCTPCAGCVGVRASAGAAGH